MNYNDFKTMAHDFFALVKTMHKPEQVEAGFHALGVAYFQMECSENERHQAAILIELASRKQDEILLQCR